MAIGGRRSTIPVAICLGRGQLAAADLPDGLCLEAGDLQAAALRAVLGGPLVELDGALDVAAVALVEPVQCLRGGILERADGNPLRFVALAYGHGEPGPGVAGLGDLPLRIGAEPADQGTFDAVHLLLLMIVLSSSTHAWLRKPGGQRP